MQNWFLTFRLILAGISNNQKETTTNQATVTGSDFVHLYHVKDANLGNTVFQTQSF